MKYDFRFYLHFARYLGVALLYFFLFIGSVVLFAWSPIIACTVLIAFVIMWFSYMAFQLAKEKRKDEIEKNEHLMDLLKR